ncbi:MAG: iron dependent repressor, metal binding and dimerization domain protein, partial [Eubacteriales bacterium]|nr:iron dependent repressor, metal binding and dimerization domain protein [Eubacteriales bacterium]
VDIVNKTGFSKPTISVQMKKFHQNGYILIDEHNYITLTPLGRAIAERTYERHQLLTNMLRSMGVDDDTAADDACRIEHYISETTFEKLKEHYETRMQKE